MPEFTVKEVRLPELHLPEIKREEIVRSLSGVRLPEVDLAKARQATMKVPAIGVSGTDVGKLLAAAAAVARYGRPAPSRAARFGQLISRRSRNPLTQFVEPLRPRRRRSRLPMALGAIAILAVAAWAVLRRPAIRRRIDAVARDVRTRIEERRAADRTGALEALEPAAPSAPGIDETETAGPSEAAPTALAALAEEPASSI